MNNSFSFHKTIVSSKYELPPLSKLEEMWNNAEESFKAAKYKDAVLAVIDYGNPELRAKFGNAAQTEFNIPHGSVVVNIKIDDKNFSLNCPFLKLPATGKIALMRRVAEINFSDLELAKIVLKDDELNFKFECPLELCYPAKIYDVLRNVCFNADYYDDEFVTQFNAVRLKEPVITAYEAKILNNGYDQFAADIKECIEYAAYFESKRMTGYAWDAYAVFFRRAAYYLKPQGNVGNIIGTAVNRLNNNKVPMVDRINEAKKTVAQLQAITKEKLQEDLYYAEEFIPWKYYGKLENIQEYFEDAHETATSEFNKGEYMACTCTIQVSYFRMLYAYRLTPEIQKFVEYNLEHASGKPWKEAAEILYASLDKFMEGDLLTAMSNEQFDSNNFMEAFSNCNFDMGSYMKQAMEMSKNFMSQMLGGKK